MANFFGGLLLTYRALLPW